MVRILFSIIIDNYIGYNFSNDVIDREPDSEHLVHEMEEKSR